MLFNVLRNLCLPWGCEDILLLKKKKNSDRPFLIENNNKEGLQANIEHVKNDCNSELCLHFYKVVVTC